MIFTVRFQGERVSSLGSARAHQIWFCIGMQRAMGERIEREM